MACYHPIEGWRGPGGKVTFTFAEAFRDLPKIKVSCGRCHGCRLEKSRDWAVRCLHEASCHDANSFVTLTYDELPENGKLKLKDWQDFAKRLRKKEKFRFFHVGEYGDENGRPHYHALLFGLNFGKDRELWTTNSRGEHLYTSKTLEETWGHGFATIGEITFESASYVTRYCMKKINGDQAAEHYRRVNTETGEEYQLPPEYTTMSRRPGIGAAWIEKYSTDVYPRDEVVARGRKMHPPKFYDNYFAKDHAEVMDEIKKRRVKTGRRQRANNTKERLATRERVAIAKSKLGLRKI